MKLINKILRCPHCGCIFLPDASTCPRCGKSCHSRRTDLNSMLTFNGMNCLTSIDHPIQSPESVAV